MTADIQALWEYFNYGLALLGLGIVYVLRQASRRLRQRRYQAMLGIEGA
jgi:ABC-2 type transport system permease protein